VVKLRVSQFHKSVARLCGSAVKPSKEKLTAYHEIQLMTMWASHGAEGASFLARSLFN